MDFEIKDGVLIKYHGNDDFVTVPDGVIRIGENAFSHNIALAKVTLPESVTEIGREAFAFCKNLLSINIPESVTSIGEKAFAGCRSLEKIRIPRHITSMSETVFAHCDKLTVFYPLFDQGDILFPTNLANISDVMKVAHGRNFELKMNDGCKYILIWLLLHVEPENSQVMQYINAHLDDMLSVIVKANVSEVMQEILGKGCFITMDNIDRLIQEAIENQCYEIQLLLTDYKYQHGGYGNTDADIQNKFSL